MGRRLIVNGYVDLFRTGIKVDRRLPKFTDIDGNTEKSVTNVSNITTPGWTFSEREDGTIGITVNGSIEAKKKKTFLQTVRGLLTREKKEPEPPKFDAVEFFAKVKTSLTNDEGDVYAKRIENYLTYLKYVESCGQTALFEKLSKDVGIAKYESLLYAKGFVKAVSEEVLEELAENAPRALCLDYVANYIRNIPIEAIKKKVEADKLKVFDNYVILHFDKDDTNTAKTEEEIREEEERRKDPIMFGVIANSNKLYYICDWVDDICDLTLDKVAEIVGKELLESSYLNENVVEQ